MNRDSELRCLIAVVLLTIAIGCSGSKSPSSGPAPDAEKLKLEADKHREMRDLERQNK